MNFRDAPGRRRRTATVVDLTALIDVVFQLLIFFLLTSSYVSQQSSASPRVDVELPESSLEAQDQRLDDKTIEINAEGALFLDGEAVTPEELQVRLVKARNKNPKTVVLIRGDQAVPYGRIAQVMSMAQAAQLQVSAVLRGR